MILLEPNLGLFCAVEMVIDTRESILETKYMDLVCITLPMAIVMKGHGMKGEGKVVECTLSEIVT